LIPEVLAADPRFRTLVRALQSTGVYTELQGAGPFTLLAPIDDAFASLPSPLADSIFEGTPVWMRVLHFHIIPGEQGLAIEIENEQSKRTLEGSDILFLRKQDKLFANEAEIIEPDIKTANGIIHVIDTVLVPPLD
jgi:transforming growth factor-beta-induced protein